MSRRPESGRRLTEASDALGAVLALDFDLLTVDEEHDLQSAATIIERVRQRLRAAGQ